MPIELFPFRFRDPVSGKWVRARYVAERHEIAARYAEWEIIGPPEVRSHSAVGYFTPYPRRPQLLDVNVDRDAKPDGDERRFVLVFLRRYVTYCARRRWFDRMEGAAALARSLMPLEGR